MPPPLTFGSNGDPFDSAPGPDGFDLSGFDTADGKTVIPAGVYTLKIERGELTRTKTGKPAYRFCFKTVEPAAHAGFTLWRWYVLADAAGWNRLVAAVRPLGFTNKDQLRAAYPPIGKDVFVKALVTLKSDPGYGMKNDIERFEPCEPPAGAVAPPNPFAVPLDTSKEGGTK